MWVLQYQTVTSRDLASDASQSAIMMGVIEIFGGGVLEDFGAFVVRRAVQRHFLVRQVGAQETSKLIKSIRTQS